jgi:hypothetical protein
MKLLLLIGLMFATSAKAENYFTCMSDCAPHLLEPKDIYIDAYRSDKVRDTYLSPLDATLDYGAIFNVDADILKWRGYGIYWNNKLFFDQERKSHHIKHGGWHYEVGAVIFRTKISDRYFSKIELFKSHESRHIFEETRTVKFPVYDRTGVRLWLSHTTN